MKAFRLAVEKGYGIELDVQLSADGIPVVFHDNTLTRMCGVNRRVRELTLAELKALSLGGTEERIPTFQEFLEMVDGRVPLIVEIKICLLYTSRHGSAERCGTNHQGYDGCAVFHPDSAVYPQRYPARRRRGHRCV